MKNPLTPAGIEPATFRIVAQNLNHCAPSVPSVIENIMIFQYAGVLGLRLLLKRMDETLVSYTLFRFP